MTRLRPLLVVTALLGLAGTVHAQDAEAPPAAVPVPPAPSAAEINKVTQYFLHGKDGGPILMDFVLCEEIGRNDQGKLDCAKELGASVKKGAGITAFVRFFGPKGGKYEDLKVKFLLDGEVRSTSDFTVTEAWTGYSNYKKTTASKTGTWTVQVLRGDTVLGEKKLTVE